MSDAIILGTDTEVGKTTLALLWLAGLEDYEYWKPVETGDSDSQLVASMVGADRVHWPLARYSEPVAPALAARRHGSRVPSADEIAAARPSVRRPGRALLVESFGSPFSPLTEDQLQVQLLVRLALPSVLVSSTAVGAIGRTLQCLRALGHWSLAPAAVVLLGSPDPFAVEQIQVHAPSVPVFELRGPEGYEREAIQRAAAGQRHSLAALRSRLAGRLPPPSAAAAPQQLLARDRRSLWHPYTSLGEPDPPLLVTSAQDEFLTLADGRRIIDGISSWWTVLHGHRHPVLMAALAEAAQRFDHVHFAGVTHPPAVELAELMLATMPWGPGGRVFFSDDGSTAVEVALKMAYQYWCHRGQAQRSRFVCFDGGYHGDTVGAMSVGRDPLFAGPFEPLLFEADRVPLSAEKLELVLGRHEGRIAAVILEPLVQGAGGMLMHEAEQLRALFQVTRRHDVLFIADEVMTGGGRTGTLWAHSQAGIEPDLVCAGKTIAGGLLPIAATLAAPRVVQPWERCEPARTFFHGHSFTAHPLACAVGVANWRQLMGGVEPEARRIERFWHRNLGPVRDWPGVREVRVRGVIVAVELDAPGGYLADVGRLMRRVCLEHGVLLRPLGNVLYALPPLCTSDRSLVQIAAAMHHAVRAAVCGTEKRTAAPK